MKKGTRQSNCSPACSKSSRASPRRFTGVTMASGEFSFSLDKENTRSGCYDIGSYLVRKRINYEP